MARRGAQEAPRGAKMAPRWPQEAPKRPPRGPQEAAMRLQEAPKRPQEAYPINVVILLIPHSLGSAVPLVAPTLPWPPQLAWATLLDGLVRSRNFSIFCIFLFPQAEIKKK